MRSAALPLLICAGCAFGQRRVDFEIEGAPAFLISPDRAAPGNPWLWYAPTRVGKNPGKETDWYFSRLLAKGFAIGGIDVGESMGNPAGRALFAKFHRAMVERHALSRRPVLMPRSRGGLMLYNWAVEHPESVGCIGGIYTVCDLSSYPGLAKAAAAYGVPEAELGRNLALHSPVDRLAPLAAEGVPVLHLHGDVDKVVPLDRNSLELVKRYGSMGGPGRVTVVKGLGHQVAPEFFESEEMLRFLLDCPRR